ncbi:winged helix-turn-helix domain-containing protein [Halocatena pleomorpha]|uniref:ArsR family transcriptional regulator n=1 Tax=Halocatena pleomorpha TaxID=1785090 RepID=A0A3P3REK5_9EURY|nr:helix-turn-helix domain-containing protein [Halocatena pleomorpha]RRJ31398.1 ArsR family transcriptional regulator [Halocatena pleomorpha]
MDGEHVGSNRLSLIPSTDLVDASTEVVQLLSSEGDDADLPAVLESLDDTKCRTILTQLDDPKSAGQLSDECSMSNSTVYRKLELLREAALVREYTEVRRDGPNATLYERDFTEISIGLDDSGEFTMRVMRRERDAEERLATFWSAMKEES